MKNNCEIKWLETIDSTNNEAYRNLQELDNLSVLAAGFQTAGRGQRGNRWLSRAWENLTFSLVLKPGDFPIDSNKQFAISEIATLSVHSYLQSRHIPCKIKWPNDLYVRDRKICGMLIENTLTGNQVSASIIGIGLNVNQTEFDPQLMNPISMKKVTGLSYDVRKELPALLDQMLRYLEMFRCPGGTAEIHRHYLNRLYRKDEFHPYRNYLTGETFTGAIRDVLPDGRLEVEASDGKRLHFAFKELGYIL